MPIASASSRRGKSKSILWKMWHFESWLLATSRTFARFRIFARSTTMPWKGLFQQVLRLALKAGAIKLGRVALDGSKIKANASKHKAMSYGRMKKEERALKEEVRKLLAQAKAADDEEDAAMEKTKAATSSQKN